MRKKGKLQSYWLPGTVALLVWYLTAHTLAWNSLPWGQENPRAHLGVFYYLVKGPFWYWYFHTQSNHPSPISDFLIADGAILFPVLAVFLLSFWQRWWWIGWAAAWVGLATVSVSPALWHHTAGTGLDLVLYATLILMSALVGRALRQSFVHRDRAGQ